jgi:hypothetical protein
MAGQQEFVKTVKTLNQSKKTMPVFRFAKVLERP